LKSFRVVSPFFTDEEVISDEFLDQCAEIFECMSEFIGMLNDVCMPDDDGNDTSEEEEDENEEADPE
jgi:hypothetical protein